MDSALRRARERATEARRRRIQLFPPERSNVFPKDSTGRPPIVVKGMHGMGDCLHQRGILPQLAERYEIWLETSWPLIYWDMPELKLLKRGTKLRTQMKNAERERGSFVK